MFKEMVVHCDDSNKIMIKEEEFKKLWRLGNLIGDTINNKYFYDFTYLLFRLRIYLEVRIPYVIEKNYNFFSEQENCLLKELHAEIEELIDKCYQGTIPYDLSEVNKIMNKFMSLYDTINNFFELRLYKNKRDTLLKELQICLEEEEYTKCRTLLLKSENDIEKLKWAVKPCEKIIINDWRKKLTNPNEYCQGENFAFVCHLGGKITKGHVSASLLTDKLLTTYGDRHVGFILDPSSIFNTSPEDCFIDNSCDEVILAVSSHILSILTKDTLESQTLDQGEDNYNEICLYDFKPIGLLVLLEDESDNFFYEIGQELKKEYPLLPLVYINKSLYKPRVF